MKIQRRTQPARGTCLGLWKSWILSGIWHFVSHETAHKVPRNCLQYFRLMGSICDPFDEIHPSIPMQRTRCLFWADQAVRKDEVHKTWHCNAKLSHGQIWADMDRWPLCGISLKMFGLIGIYTAGGAVAAEMFQFQHRQHRSRCQSRCFSSVQITHWALRLPALRADPTVHNARGRWSTCDAVNFIAWLKNTDKRR